MSTLQKWLAALFFGGCLTIIITTWGSIASMVLTLALLLAAAGVLIRWWMDTHDPEDFRWEE